MEFVFGSGSLWGVPLTNIAGTSVANPTPLKFGILQDVSADFDFTNKELYGTYQFPVAIGRGKAKVSFKAKFARLNLNLFNNVLFGQSASGQTVGAPQTTIQEDEADTIPANTAYTINTTYSANFVRDLGVYYSATGLPLAAGSAVAAGVYTVANGVYTFSNTDANAAVLISYEYTANTGIGLSMTIANQLLGQTPTLDRKS